MSPDGELAGLQAELEQLMAASTTAGLRGYDQMVRLYDAAFERLFSVYRARLAGERGRIETRTERERQEAAVYWQRSDLAAFLNNDRQSEQPREE